ncbi:hypothetical protein [Novosphingobium sp.]|uniref:hypothetical protein n=1 Tax=Novosphingobium sp. TaxID=1874826 RepID=UPI0038B76C94
MITRRALLGNALVAASTIGPAGAAIAGVLPPGVQTHRTISALLIDRTVRQPRELSALIEVSRRSMPVVDLTLDAVAHNTLQQCLRDNEALVGISSGATLFCLERLAWDHGHRLTVRAEANGTDCSSLRRAAAAFLSGARPAAAPGLSPPGAYAPSRADGVVHVWIIERKSSVPSGQTGAAQWS